jgi:deoxyribodipyrimidine photolyase-related protein
MTHTLFILFPNQLFSVNDIPREYLNPKTTTFFLVEHPIFFGFRPKMKMNFQKKKIVLHRASCLEYIDEMKAAGQAIHFIDMHSFIRDKFGFITDHAGDVVCFDPVDYELMEILNGTFRERLTVLETPNFLTHTKDLISFYEKHGGAGSRSHFFHSTFYKWQIDHLSIPYISRSYDVENREAIPEDVSPPTVTSITGTRHQESKHLSTAVKFCELAFPKNYGTTDGFYLPTTRKAAAAWLKRFIEHRLLHFGKYQDAIIPTEPFLFHSVISPMLNIGLISPFDVVKEAILAYKRHRVPVEAYEGFMRQVIGWREYQRFIYLFLYKDIVDSNHFSHKRRITRHWYTGTTGLAPLDDAIQTAFKWGYINHIQRLMVVTNAMTLCEMLPDDAYRWFMEFSVDSYDWVMIGNVYSMGLWADGGLTMRKPYISSDKYIQTMAGNRFPSGEWEAEWRALYYHFLSKNAVKLRGTPYIRNLVHWNRMSQAEKRELGETARAVIKKVTK